MRGERLNQSFSLASQPAAVSQPTGLSVPLSGAAEAQIELTIPLREKARYSYIHIDEHNRVYILLPWSGGSTISIDTTCQAAGEYNRFWHGDSQQSPCTRVVNTYIQDLEFDLQILRTSSSNDDSRQREIITLKQARWEQLQAYKDMLSAIA